ARAIAVADPDEGAGPLVQHKREVLRPHHRRQRRIDVCAARDRAGDGCGKLGLSFVIDEYRIIPPVIQLGFGAVGRRRSLKRTSGARLRAVPRSFTVCGMTLSVLPASNIQIETTADLRGSTFRDTTD